MGRFVPLSKRISGEPLDEVLPLDVPAHLQQPLFDWLQSTNQYDDSWQPVCLVLQIAPKPDREQPYLNGMIAAINQNSLVLLDLIDARLKFGNLSELPRKKLQMILAFGGSGWRMNGDHSGLEEVVDATATLAAYGAMNGVGSSADHLRKAWAACYGLNRNPTVAHSEAIKAVECAAAPVITPNNLKATLGSIVGELRGTQAKWTTGLVAPATDGTAVVLSMMETLWTCQTDRHGATTPTVLATQPRAEMTVHMAATLVQIFNSGHVKMR